MKRYYELCITHIDWDVDPGETPTLPISLNKLMVIVKNEDELDDAVVEALTEEYGWCINNVDFVINSISFKLTKRLKLRYIIKTYDDPEWIRDYKSMINEKWKFVYYPNTEPGEYDCKLFISGEVQDELSREYVEDILEETI